jgi:ketosteroid isomerase-like protein
MREAEELVRRLIDAHNRGADVLLASYDELLDPEYEFTPATVGAPDGATYKGREGLRRYYEERAEAFAEGQVEIRSCEQVGDDAIVVCARSTGRGRASGAVVDEEINLVYRVRGGRIASSRAFRSREEAAEVARA